MNCQPFSRSCRMKNRSSLSAAGGVDGFQVHAPKEGAQLRLAPTKWYSGVQGSCDTSTVAKTLQQPQKQ